ncbi:site-specific DNA-methyltransferase (cytosine-N4-specific) [Methanococcus maripaludis]|uniref:Type II methyltransferase n=1 Tax=Methanococcus maripaludis TaxID=39152 RepID=A0A7J9P7E3_METMI|nr:site-specific DNA-methyltransferase [Methanococcus maripaludis]MBA2858668.1 site-specific DNA-methyltransferase (cytosine-N4-specific) [Methanococcus maripaludis]
MLQKAYETDFGTQYLGKIEEFIDSEAGTNLKGKVQLLLTSPPFPMNNKKKYGNLQGQEYVDWFSSLAEGFSKFLTKNGSIVIELGNSWEHGRPVQSLLSLESFLAFLKNEKADLKLCQEFIVHNPSRLPSPAQWVTVNRIRTIDSFTKVWWMSPSDYPKSDNKKVLRPYSKSMLNLLKRKSYNAGSRPSEHVIGDKSFLKDNGGSIVPNVIEIEQIDDSRERRVPGNVFSIANTRSNDYYMKTCRENNIKPHPARMPLELASFFIEFLTDPGDIVLDPFGGSNTTGFCAERSGRKWISIEAMQEYTEQAMIRFKDPAINSNIRKEIY